MDKKGTMGLVELTNENFEKEVIQSDLPTIIEFYSTTCTVCTKLTPLLEKVSSGYDGKAKFVKCNIYENPQIASKLGIKWASQLAVVYKERPLGVFPGAQGVASGQITDAIKEESLKDRINNYLERI